MKKINNTPFTSDIQYIEALARPLTLRVQKLVAQERLRELTRDGHHSRTLVGHRRPASLDEARRQVAALADRERDALLAIEARRRVTPGRLGLDELLRIQVTGEEAERLRLPLVALVLQAVCPPEAEPALDGLSFGTLSVSQLTQLMDPRGLKEYLDLRRLWRPSGPLLRGNVITIDFCTRTATVSDLSSAPVELTASAVASILGDEGLADEGKTIELPQPRKEVE